MNNLLVLLNFIIARKSGNNLQHTESTFSSHTHQSMKHVVGISAHWPNLVANRTQYFSCHVNISASGIPFGRYPTFHTLMSVGRKKVLSVR